MALHRQDRSVQTAGEPSVDIHGLPLPPAWISSAMCAQVDPDGMFPEQGGNPAALKAVCARCPVVTPCLDHALDRQEPYGIWGGRSAAERRRILRKAAS
ncbi:WhiB family transcriptional regulator [Nocardioides sp. 503]|uniref:WhiB family transcriptional regulator n=1 Tax=Nocardioides sp. 503 TaxID=2508326 RepID=UPI00106F4CB5|nr:WhiB family transcriptional regulator [Nocardioides sp. 503]